MSEEKKVWTMNPARVRFLFEDSIGMQLSITHPYYSLPDGLDATTRTRYLTFLDKAVKDGVLLEGKHELIIHKPVVSESVVDCAKILDVEINTNNFKATLINICKSDTRFLESGKIRSAQNDLDALFDYERSHRNRAGILAMIKKALSGEYGKFTGGISQVEETEEAQIRPELLARQAQASGGDPFAD